MAPQVHLHGTRRGTAFAGATCAEGPHFRFKPLQTSHLTSNLICQHTFLSYLVHMQQSWYWNMVWKGDMLDTALPIIPMQCDTGRRSMGMNKYTAGDSRALPSRYLTADTENNQPVNPSPLLQMHTQTHRNTTLQSCLKLWGCEDRRSDRSRLQSLWQWKTGVRCSVKRHQELTELHTDLWMVEWTVRDIALQLICLCLSKNLFLRRPGWHVLKVNRFYCMTNSNFNFNFCI